MKRALDNGLMLTDLDADFHIIRNVGDLHPPPINLLAEGDYRLSDNRTPIDGSVTNDKVADNAGIVQSKLTLTGDIPTNYFGTDDTHAAQGSLVQPLSEKDQPNGYVSLDVDSKLPPGSTTTSGTGTLHEIDFDLPIAEITTVPDDTGTTKTFTGYWAAQDAGTWFGNFSGATAIPTFTPQTVLPASLIPGFDASRIISGTFEVDRLPASVGVGVDHSSGLTPPPGSSATAPTAQPTDYLGRDMEYHPMVTLVSYQPTLAAPSISVQSYYISSANVNITQFTFGTNLFYKVQLTPLIGSDFAEVTTLPILVPVGAQVQAYAAKIGWNNSDISVYTIPPNPAPPALV